MIVSGPHMYPLTSIMFNFGATKPSIIDSFYFVEDDLGPMKIESDRYLAKCKDFFVVGDL